MTSRLITRILSTAAIAPVLIAVPALAQTTEATPSTTAAEASPAAVASPAPQGQQADIGAPGDIVVTARRREERLQDVPVAITALSADTIQQTGAADVMQIAQLVPSLVVGRQLGGSGASIFLRGVGSSPLSSGFDQSVSTVVDGVPMARGREVVFAQYDLAQIEVLKGPQALFFGKNSTGGIINISTANPTSRFEANVRYGYEFAADKAYGEGYVSGPLSDTLRARFAVRASAERGAFINTGGPGIDQFGMARDRVSSRRGANNTLAGRFTLDWKPNDVMDWRLKVSGTMYREPNGNDLYERKCGQGRTTPLASAGVPNPYADCRIDGRADHSNVPAAYARTTRYFEEDPYTRNDSYAANLTGNIALGENFNLNTITGFYGFKQQDLADYNGSTAINVVGQRSTFDQFSQELRIDSDMEGPFNFTVGAFYAHGDFFFGATNVGQFTVADVDGRYNLFDRDAGFKSKSYSFFAAARIKLAETLELAGGARYSNDRKDSYTIAQPNNIPLRAAFPYPKSFFDVYKDDDVSPEATLTWKPTGDTTVYAAYKRGYKAGGFNTSFSLTAAAQAADASFAAEKARGGEVGIRTRLLDRALSLNLTAYNYTYADLQVQIFDPITISSRISNAAALRTRGVEGEFSYLLPNANGAELHGSFAYNDAPFKDYVGLCYTGQTVAEGCSLVPNAAGTAFTSQNYAGRQAPKAPKFAARLGGSVPITVTPDWTATPWVDVGYSSSYNYTDTLRPDGVQKRFARLDAGVRVNDDVNDVEFAIIGRNLTNRLIVTSANDFSYGSGVGGTGTAVGLASDLNVILDMPRQVFLQVTKRF